MSYLSLTDVITDLYSRFAADPSQPSSAPVAALPLVTQVYDHEPKPGDAQTPIAVTLFPSSITPEFFEVAIRVYSSVATDPRAATRNLETTVQQVDKLLPSTVGPSNWQIAYSDPIDALVATIVVQGGREDYF